MICVSGLAAGDKPPVSEPLPPAPMKSKYGPRDVEIKLQDGSFFRGEVSSDIETIVLKTVYGALSVPIKDMLRIDRGERVTEKESKDIAENLKDLDNDEYAKRSAAQYKLETGTAASAEVIKAARETASPESKNRIDQILKKLAAKNPAKKVQNEDSIRTVRFEALGLLELGAMKIKTRVGDLAVKVEDIQSVRWLNRGEAKTLTLAPMNMGEWVDTGIDAAVGDKLAIIVSGTINPFNNQDVGPMGSDNWGNSGQFLMGAVVGRLGATGDQFLVGNGKVWTTESKERLFLKIHWNFNRTGRSGNEPKGSYTVKIASGAWADDVDANAIHD